jgi:hypothetical protein
VCFCGIAAAYPAITMLGKLQSGIRVGRWETVSVGDFVLCYAFLCVMLSYYVREIVCIIVYDRNCVMLEHSFSCLWILSIFFV